MMSRDFPEYAELWREQIGPEELALFQARAKNIERNAKRKRLLDFALWFVAIGMVCLFLWFVPTSLQIKLGYALLVAGTIWFVWRRHQITRASRAIAIDDPRVFFETAIKTVRAELNLSTMSLYMGLPFFITSVLLAKSAQGIDGFDLIRQLPDVNFATAMIVAIVFLFHGYIVRENIKLREQLRRLESMRREWDEQQARDLAEGP